MSKDIIKRINKISTKIMAMADRLEEDGLTPRHKKNLRLSIVNKKATLNNLCKLYLWRVE